MQLEQQICQERLHEENAFLMHFDGEEENGCRPEEVSVRRRLFKTQCHRNKGSGNIFEPVLQF